MHAPLLFDVQAYGGGILIVFGWQNVVIDVLFLKIGLAMI